MHAIANKLLLGEVARAEIKPHRHIPYIEALDNHTLRTRNGDLVSTMRLEGLSHSTRSDRELDMAKEARALAWKNKSGQLRRYGLWTHTVRRREDRYPAGSMPDGFCSNLDQAWRRVVGDGAAFRNETYLSLVRWAPRVDIGAWSKLADMFGGQRHEQSALADARRKALAEHSGLFQSLAQDFSSYRPGLLQTPQQLAFLAALINGYWSESVSAAPGLPLQAVRIDIDNETIWRRRPCGRARPAAVIGIQRYREDTLAGILDDLLTLPVEFTITQSFHLRDSASQVERVKRQHGRYANSEDDAISQADDLALAVDDLASNRIAFGAHHLSILIDADNQDELQDHVRLVESTVGKMGFLTRRERAAAEATFWASLPGNARYIARKADITTSNFAGLASFHAYPEGKIDGNHWGPAIAALETNAGTPYYFSWHVADVGHTAILGPTGTGKTVTSMFLTTMSQRVPGIRTAVLDKDRGAEIAVRAMGGEYRVLAAGQPTGWAPFALEDTAESRGFLRGLMAEIATAHAEKLTDEEDQLIADMVEKAFTLSDQDRRLRNVVDFLPKSTAAGSLWMRFKPWYGDGEHAWIFDGEPAEFRLAQTQGFDLTAVLKDPRTSGAVIAYLLYQIRLRLDGSPYLINIEEGWYALASPRLAKEIEDLILTVRKLGGSVIFGTQRPQAALESSAGRAILDQVATKIVLPHPDTKASALEEALNLTEYESRIVRRLPKESRCFLVKQDSGSVICSLNLGRDGVRTYLPVLAGTAETVALMDRLRDQHGDDPAVWLPEFLAQTNGGKS